MRRDRAQVVGAGERESHAADGGFAGVFQPVVVGIDIDETGERSRLEFAEVVVGRVGVLSQP